MFDLILYVPFNNRTGLVLSKENEDMHAVIPLRIEPTTPLSRVKHSTTALLETEGLQVQAKVVYFGDPQVNPSCASSA